VSVNEARFAIVAADFYEDLAARLISGAKAELSEAGAVTIDEFRVPGAFELPLAAQQAVKAGYHAVVCVGAVIRGETDHYDWVCAEAARGIMQVGLDSGVPCGFGLLTVDNLDQAIARSGGDKRDSGRHAAAAVLAQLKIASELGD
jgi:6,7-dimethyl-8-ribityllumazine synthase